MMDDAPSTEQVRWIARQVPFRAACTYLQYGYLRLAVCLPNCVLLISYVIYKETAFGLCRLFLLHQGRIPRHTCRFYCCLAAHQRTKEMDSAEPLSSILWTPPPHPEESAAAGKCRLPRAYRNIGSCIQVQVAYPHFDMMFGCFVFGLRSFAFQ